MVLYFITGNENKYLEIQRIIPELEMEKIDLVEIQENNPKKIIEHKLKEALRLKPGLKFIVEDTSFYMDCLNGQPGPFIKWFMQDNSLEEIYEIAKKLGNLKARVKTIIGYLNSKGEINYFEGVLEGEIVKPRTKTSFGWDPIFRPKGYEKSFGEMSGEEKNKVSMRGIAARKLKEFLISY